MTATLDKKSKKDASVWQQPDDWPMNPLSFGRGENHLKVSTDAFINDGRDRGWYRFNFVEQPGGLLEFTFDVPQPKGVTKHVYEKYSMMDQETYYLPHDVAVHLNNIFVPKPKIRRNSNGMISMDPNHKVNRFYLIPAPKPQEDF